MTTITIIAVIHTITRVSGLEARKLAYVDDHLAMITCKTARAARHSRDYCVTVIKVIKARDRPCHEEWYPNQHDILAGCLKLFVQTVAKGF